MEKIRILLFCLILFTTRLSSASPLTVTFLDVGQALSVLVTFPNGHHILVDTGDSSDTARQLEGLVPDNRIDLLWITHPHTDHYGGAAAVLQTFQVLNYVDDGEDSDKPTLEKVHQLVRSQHAIYAVVNPTHPFTLMLDSGPVLLTGVVPSRWAEGTCAGQHANNCSIGLRLDYQHSSVLFIGDAEVPEEKVLTVSPATLLQVGHHGSNTSSSEFFLRAVQPHYAVVSSGHPEVGTNRTYCHPQEDAVDRLSLILKDFSHQWSKAVVFDNEVACRSSQEHKHWDSVDTPDNLWFTARDGRVTLSTEGDGVFTRK